MIRQTLKVGGLTIAPAPASPLGGDLVVITAALAGAGLDRDELAELRDVIDEALR